MFSFFTSHCHHNAATKSHYNDAKKPRRLSKLWQTLKSCIGHGCKVDMPPRNEYQRAGNPAIGFEGEEVYGIRAEYLDEDDLAWGKPRKPKKRPNHGITDRM